MSALHAPPATSEVFWIFRTKDNDIAHSTYTRNDAREWVVRQPQGTSWDILRVTTDTEGHRLARVLQTLKGQGIDNV